MTPKFEIGVTIGVNSQDKTHIVRLAETVLNRFEQFLQGLKSDFPELQIPTEKRLDLPVGYLPQKGN